jgi:outer membrane receptor for ferrienterochelin and colicins
LIESFGLKGIEFSKLPFMKSMVKIVPAVLPLLITCGWHAQASAQTSDSIAPALPANSATPAKPQPTAQPGLPPKAETPAQPTELNKVEVKASREADSSNGITRTIGQSELTKYGDDNVLDILKRQPGISVSGGQISLRGIGSAFVRVLVDGQRPPPGFSLDTLSPQMVERIEVIPGSSVEFSAQSIGGTINIVLKRTRGSKQATLSLGLDGSEITKTARATGTWGDTVGPWSWLITSNLRASKDTPTDTLETSVFRGSQFQDNRLRTTEARRENQSLNFSPRLTYTPSKDTRIQSQVGSWTYRSRDTPQLRTTVFSGPSSVFDQFDGLHADRGHGYWINSEWSQTLNDTNKLEMKSRTGRWYNRHQFARDFNQALPSQTQKETENSRGEWFFLGTTWRHSWNTDQNISIGLETERNADKASRSDLINSEQRLSSTEQFERSAVKQWAGFVRHEFQVNDSWATDLGVRWESLQFDVDLGTANQRASKQTILAPSIQAQYKPGGSKTEQYRIELGRKWKPIRTQELRLRRTLALDNRFETPDSTGNPNLVPEIALSLDLAYTRKVGEDGNVGVTLLAKKIDNIVQNRVTFQDLRWVNRPENVGSGKIAGIELEYKSRLSDLVDSWPKTQVRANVGRYWSKLDSIVGTGNRVASQTPMSVGMGFDHKLTSLPVTWGANFKWSEKGLQRDSQFQTQTLSNERNLSLYGLWTFSPQTSMRLAADNLLSRPNQTTTEYARSDVLQIDQAIVPVKPTLRLNIELKG